MPQYCQVWQICEGARIWIWGFLRVTSNPPKAYLLYILSLSDNKLLSCPDLGSGSINDCHWMTTGHSRWCALITSCEALISDLRGLVGSCAMLMLPDDLRLMETEVIGPACVAWRGSEDVRISTVLGTRWVFICSALALAGPQCISCGPCLHP